MTVNSHLGAINQIRSRSGEKKVIFLFIHFMSENRLSPSALKLEIDTFSNSELFNQRTLAVVRMFVRSVNGGHRLHGKKFQPISVYCPFSTRLLPFRCIFASSTFRIAYEGIVTFLQWSNGPTFQVHNFHSTRYTLMGFCCIHLFGPKKSM